MYDTISIPLFISSYMQVMKAEKPVLRPRMATHLVELMEDTQFYSWKCVHAFNAVWLQQLKHSTAL